MYSNNQEFEVVRLNDQLISYSDETKLMIKHGRALKFGETRVKIYFLRPNEEEVCSLPFHFFRNSFNPLYDTFHVIFSIFFVFDQNLIKQYSLSFRECFQLKDPLQCLFLQYLLI